MRDAESWETGCWLEDRGQIHAFRRGKRRPLPMAKSKRKRAPKTVLKLPDLEQLKSAVLNSLTSSSSKRSLLIGCGIRRAEVTNLRLEDLQLREGHWVIADLRGKGGHIRTIPVPQWVKEAVDSWTVGAGITSGPLLRSINKAGRIWGHGFTPKVIWAIVKANAKSSVCHRWHRTI